MITGTLILALLALARSAVAGAGSGSNLTGDAYVSPTEPPEWHIQGRQARALLQASSNVAAGQQGYAGSVTRRGTTSSWGHTAGLNKLTDGLNGTTGDCVGTLRMARPWMGVLLPSRSAIDYVTMVAPPDCWLANAAQTIAAPDPAAFGNSCTSVGLHRVQVRVADDDVLEDPFIDLATTTLCAVYSSTAVAGETINVTCTSTVYGRSVIILRELNLPSALLAMCELQVYGSPSGNPPPPPASPPPPPSAGSLGCQTPSGLIAGCSTSGPGSDGTNVCANAYDGNTGSYWSRSTTGAGMVMELRLRTAYHVCSVEVEWSCTVAASCTIDIYTILNTTNPLVHGTLSNGASAGAHVTAALYPDRDAAVVGLVVSTSNSATANVYEVTIMVAECEDMHNIGQYLMAAGSVLSSSGIRNNDPGNYGPDKAVDGVWNASVPAGQCFSSGPVPGATPYLAVALPSASSLVGVQALLPDGIASFTGNLTVRAGSVAVTAAALLTANAACGTVGRTGGSTFSAGELVHIPCAASSITSLSLEPRSSKPFAAQPVAAEPPTAQPRSPKPFAAQPRSTQPCPTLSSAFSPTQPRSSEPRAAQPPATQPCPALPSALTPTQPRSSKPFAAQPFAAEPPAAQPRSPKPGAA
ncbi:hypothetical protein HYH03_002180 [Edaphochlamys debaryana]|uniref:Uncharacterized protein n=1 Tax=Edaphochlamys debaryana TaxID=47281 RepID=A0A835YBJ3_9CHLO|nr:hypothetical protein HYH03_002180 [Edaphochlamys debaryana]|eukprot:KAG2499892.1 hypothetical protein HYH03_002180 [Edaphochlamys debaryana]